MQLEVDIADVFITLNANNLEQQLVATWKPVFQMYANYLQLWCLSVANMQSRKQQLL